MLILVKHEKDFILLSQSLWPNPPLTSLMDDPLPIYLFYFPIFEKLQQTYNDFLKLNNDNFFQFIKLKFNNYQIY